MHPALDAIEEDAEADGALLESIADWCLRYTPLVALDPPDGLLLDICGCAHLYGGEDALVADLSGRLEAAGFAYRIAIAGSIGAAWAAAHHGEPASHACGGERALLSPLPLAALRLDGGTVAALARVGLKRIGDIIDLPRAPLDRALRRGAAAPARPRAGPRARAAHSAPAGRALRRRAAFRRADRARGGRAGHRRAAGRRG